MKFKLGLTGSIGMGKSTTAKMFADEGCVIWDADKEVHDLYAVGGAAVKPIGQAFPQSLMDGSLNRSVLKEIIRQDKSALKRLEDITHPLVFQKRQEFTLTHPNKIGVFDIPLLFETGADSAMDATACVNVSRETQRERVLSRGTMTKADLDEILKRQIPNLEKCRLAKWVIDTQTLEGTHQQVRQIMSEIRQGVKNA